MEFAFQSVGTLTFLDALEAATCNVDCKRWISHPEPRPAPPETATLDGSWFPEQPEVDRSLHCTHARQLLWLKRKVSIEAISHETDT